MGDLSRNFNRSEFECGDCCGKADIRADLIRRLQNARDEYSKPISINSGYRCPSHNRAIGGDSYSAHMFGFAVDINVQDSHHRWELIPILLKHFKRMGIYSSWIHVDCDPGKPLEVVWYG